MTYILIAALAPVAMLLYYIYRKDEFQKEPVKEVLKAFGLGVASIFLSLMISGPFGAIGLYPAEQVTLWDGIAISFFGAAIPEEIAKFLLFWLFVRRNKYFDEHMDGIVYAAAVSLGFAGLENVMYLFSNAESYLSVGIARALFAVPGHFCFGILMGYYYSLAKFYPKTPQKNKALILVAPIIVHGLYDSILFIINVTPAISGILVVAFLIFCHKMWMYGSRRLKEHLERDSDRNC